MAQKAKKRDKGAQDALVKYVESVPETTCMVFMCPGKAHAASPLYKAIVKSGALVSCPHLSFADAARWVAQTARKHGKRISPKDAADIVTMTGVSLSELHGELMKLIAYVGEAEEIGAGDIEALITVRGEYGVFGFVDKLAAADVEEALRMLRAMFENGEDAFGILPMLTRQIRLILYSKRLIRRGYDPGGMEAVLDVRGFAVRKALSLGERLLEEQLARSLEDCAKLDWAIKSGEMRDANAALVALTLKLGERFGKRARSMGV